MERVHIGGFRSTRLDAPAGDEKFTKQRQTFRAPYLRGLGKGLAQDKLQVLDIVGQGGANRPKTLLLLKIYYSMTLYLERPFLRAVFWSATILSLLTSRVPADEDSKDNNHGTQVATGQYITPTVIPGSVQQLLNPGLPLYPNFVAGEAVKSQLSPDGTTLAIICAGQNSLDNAAGSLDVANSTQYIFLYNVAGTNKAKPALTQVIRQTNAHVGLVFSPNGNTLYAAGGNDDAVYVYDKSGGTFLTPGTQIALGHYRRRQDVSGRKQLQRLDQRDRHCDESGPLRIRSAPVQHHAGDREWPVR